MNKTSKKAVVENNENISLRPVEHRHSCTTCGKRLRKESVRFSMGGGCCEACVLGYRNNDRDYPTMTIILQNEMFKRESGIPAIFVSHA